MADQDSTTRQAVLNALLASGFPFQTAIAEIARQVPGYNVLAEEFPWRDETGTDHFLDLIIFKRDFNLIVPIECKKTQKEILTFLQSTAAVQRDSVRARSVYLNQIQDSTMRFELFCADWDIKPKSEESSFCVVSTSDSGRDQRMLERDAQLLIRGADAFGRYVKEQRRTQPPEQPDQVIVPLIVTNAKLFQARYYPGDISLETGQLPTSPRPDISSIEWVRFRKAFTASGRDAGERTIFVVTANSLQKFLRELEIITSFPKNKVQLA